MKKLSIITICYNEPNLEKTCDSIANQSWQDFEWIVVDGDSNDETLAIFEKYKHRIDKFISESDNGIYDAFNKGIKLATGKYLNFMNAGDLFYHRDTLRLFDYFTKNNCADIYYGECEFYKNSKKSTITHYPQVLSKYFFETENICMQGMFIKKDLFDKYGSFVEKYKILSDLERWLHFFSLGVSFCYIPIIVAVFDLNGISATAGKSTLNEHIDVANCYFSQDSIKRIMKCYKPKYTLLENLFSIKNGDTEKHKILTILGIHFIL